MVFGWVALDSHAHTAVSNSKAWVRFVEPAGATAAVNELNGKLLGGQNMVVDMARSKKRQVKPGRGAGGGSGAAAGGRSLLGAPQQTLDSTLILL